MRSKILTETLPCFENKYLTVLPELSAPHHFWIFNLGRNKYSNLSQWE